MIGPALDVVRLNVSHGTRADRAAPPRAGAAGGRATPTATSACCWTSPVRRSASRASATARCSWRRARRSRSIPRWIPRPAPSNVVGCAYKNLPHDVRRRRHAAAVRRADRARRERGRGHAHRHARARRRRAVGSQGPEPPGRRHLGAGAVREGPRGHPAGAAEQGIDYVAVSFARDAADIKQARTLVREAGGDARIVAKIERHEAHRQPGGASSTPPTS